MTALQAQLAQARDNLRHQHPSSQLWLELARLEWRQGEFFKAKASWAKAQALGGLNADDFCDFGVLRMTTGDPVDLAIPLLQACLALDPRHPGGLEWLAYAHMVRQELEPALGLYQALCAHQPREPRFSLLLAQAQRLAGQERQALVSLETSLRLSLERYQATREPGCLTHMVQALHLAGQDKPASSLLAQLAQLPGGPQAPGLNWAQAGYLPGMPQRLARLREVVAGRDLVILAKGPSLARFDQAVERFAQHDLCYFIFNGSGAEDTILAKIGRQASLACMSASKVLRDNLAWVRGFLARPQAGLFFTDAHCMDSLTGPPTRAELEARHDERLMYFRAVHKYFPSPADPLHFPPVNTLSMVLPLAVLGRPRRIFLFGCDGAVYAKPGQRPGAFYYFADQEALNAGQRDLERYRQGYEQWLRYDTFQFDAQIKTSLACLAATHGLSVPAIYNCSPESAYQSFPKLGTGGCLALLRE